MRIFIGLAEVSGYYTGLKEGFDELGVESIHVSLQDHPFKYENPESIPFAYKLSKYCVTKRVKKMEKGFHWKWFWSGLVLISRLILFLWALCKYDVFLLSCGNSFFRFKEFPILKFLGKKIIYIFHGTDSRPAYIDGFAQEISNIFENGIGDSIIRKYLAMSCRRWHDVKRVERYADVIIQNLPTGIFHERPFVHFLIAGIPIRKNKLLPSSGDRRKEDEVKILHSPSHKEGKGTEEIRGAIKSLKKKGYKIDYIEISGKPNIEVLKEIQNCDFVIDQLYSNTPMAGFATEAAMYGKPAVVGGYYSKHITADLRPEFIPPSLYCLPEKIEQAIERLILDENFRVELGRKASDFVNTNWSAKSVALRYLSLIHGDFPREWLYDPREIQFVCCAGLNNEKAKIIIRSIVEKYGRKALCLCDKPELEQKFIDFAYGK